MKKTFRRRPSASMVVAMLALVIGASGTAVASGNLVNGDKLIKKHSLSGNRLVNHAITRQQINFSRLGTVPSANDANFAKAAATATTAGNANTVGGLAPSAFEASSNTVRSGLVGLQMGATTTLATFGPFTLTLKCINSGGQPESQILVSSGQPGSDVDGSLLPLAAR